MSDRFVLPTLVTFDTAAATTNVLPVLVGLSPALSLLGSAVIDGKSTGSTTLLTVPDGKRCVPSAVILVMTSASNVTGVASIGVGDDGTFDNIVASSSLTNFDATGCSYRNDMSSGSAGLVVVAANNPAAAQVIKLEVDTAATTTAAGDTYTFNAYLFGLLV